MKRRRVAKSKSVPAPIKGWNARDSIAQMDPLYAVKLENWFPTTSDVLMRKGHQEHATGLPGAVESLMPYEIQLGGDELYAASDDGVYEVTTTGAVGAAIVTGLTNTRFQHVNFTDSGGAHYLIAVNGEDLAQYYNGTAWVAVDDSTTPAITGVTTSDLINVAEHKKFLWFVEKNSMSLWYMPVGTVGGAATEFLLNGVFSKGGKVIDIGTWTLDAGEGLDDYFAVITSQGECAIYRGTNPSSASTFALVGVWSLAAPIGNRVFTKYGGDLLAILDDGLQPMSKALLSSQVTRSTALTDSIRGAMSESAATYGTNFGWDLLHYPRGNMLILNVPVAEGSRQVQYVMNTITGAWCQFNDVPANCWALFGENPYFGGDGVVSRFWNNFDDDAVNIEADAQQAFSYFGQRGEQKRWTMARPIFQTIGSPSVSLGLNVDYRTIDPTSILMFSPQALATWDVDVWDASTWGGQLQALLQWTSVSGIGYCAAPRLKAASKGVETRWVSTDFIYEKANTPI